jgi:VIT1/CCC1 family predicted Fe2+/Mn2+ transporter
MSSSESQRRRSIRNAVIGLAAAALAFYFGFIALAVFRSQH